MGGSIATSFSKSFQSYKQCDSNKHDGLYLGILALVCLVLGMSDCNTWLYRPVAMGCKGGNPPLKF